MGAAVSVDEPSLAPASALVGEVPDASPKQRQSATASGAHKMTLQRIERIDTSGHEGDGRPLEDWASSVYPSRIRRPSARPGSRGIEVESAKRGL